MRQQGMELHELFDLLDKVELSHPHMVDLKGRGSAGKTPDDIPGAAPWLAENVPFNDWEYVTSFGNMIFYFKDKAKATLFKLFFE